ncbi:HPP family-domain-containing protein [Cladorrhinum samala]|uniref:HPP family-domain-containing protein n=1 Tax=Cladorrhinum samala TaxID=585594 RepID=A0AAV9HNG2_9PEZI|nr:HPP family-domain-containing protein [Cladorrhinum samala]
MSPSIIHRWSRLHFDIDKHLNPYFPVSILPKCPSFLAHFLGHRPYPTSHHPRGPLGNIPMIFWAFVGVFASIAFIGGVGLHVPAFKHKGAPTIIGSFGAAAVLDFYAIESPLAQPRNAILGQIVSSVTGIIISKLFQLAPNFEEIRWVGAALSCATATAVMALTGTVHPPAGATALMAVVDEDVSRMGWFLLVPVLLGCGLMLVAALLVNNIQRRFPFYWWSPSETGQFWAKRRAKKSGGEKEGEDGDADENALRRERSGVSSGGLGRSTDEEGSGGSDGDEELQVIIKRGEVIIPDGLTLRPEEVMWLETISQRL